VRPAGDDVPHAEAGEKMTVIIHNIREGFAANSSSTHSIIILPDGAKQSDNLVDGLTFGWEPFIAASPEAKRDWLFATLAGNCRGGRAVEYLVGLNDSYWRELFGPYMSMRADKLATVEAYVDHQSCIHLPGMVNRPNVIHGGFFKALCQYIMSPSLVVVGGNDNDDEGGPHIRGQVVGYRSILPVESARGADDLVCRQEDGWFTLFLKRDGFKTRISFAKGLTNTVNVVKAKAPELVDVKLTDFCSYGCAYCYQGSTTRGQHASLVFIKSLALALQEMGVFEVALGGGEPTEHPEFFKIVQQFRNEGIVPNFTTRSLDWLSRPYASELLKLVGAVAFSVNNGADVERMKAIVEPLRDADLWPRDTQLHFQYVIGTGSDDDLRGVFEKAEYDRVTLLGYKTNGRGKTFQARLDQDWITITNQCRLYKFGIDTALARQWSMELKRLKIPLNTWHTEEGKFSCYVDAVQKTVAPSSYCDDAQYVSIAGETTTYGEVYPRGQSLHDKILAAFKEW
jgi:hypothetical protein